MTKKHPKENRAQKRMDAEKKPSASGGTKKRPKEEAADAGLRIPLAETPRRRERHTGLPSPHP